MDEFDDLLDDGPGGAFLFEEEDLDEHDDLDDLAEDDLSDDDDPADNDDDPSRLPWMMLGAAAGAALFQPAWAAAQQSRRIVGPRPYRQHMDPTTRLVTVVFELTDELDPAAIERFRAMRTRRTYEVEFSGRFLNVTCHPHHLATAMAEVINDLEASWR